MGLIKRIKFFIKLFIHSDKIDIDDFRNLILDSIISDKSKIHGFHHIVKSHIDDYSYVANNSHIFFTNIGKYCSIGPNFYCGRGIHPTNGVSTSPMFYSTKKQNGFSLTLESKIDEIKKISIGNDVFIGANVTVLDGVWIGDGAIIGAGAVVSKNIPPYAIAVGVPIKIIKYRFSDNIIKELLQLRWWDYSSLGVHTEVENNFFKIEEFIDKIKSIKKVV